MSSVQACRSCFTTLCPHAGPPRTPDGSEGRGDEASAYGRADGSIATVDDGGRWPGAT